MLLASSQMRTSTRLRSRLSFSVRAARVSAAWRAARAACSPASSSRASPAPAASAKARATSTSLGPNSRWPESVSTSTWRIDSRTRMGSSRAVRVLGSAPSARASVRRLRAEDLPGRFARVQQLSQGCQLAERDEAVAGGSGAGRSPPPATRPSSSAIDSSIVLRARKKRRASPTRVSATALGPPASMAVPRRRETACMASPASPKRADSSAGASSGQRGTRSAITR